MVTGVYWTAANFGSRTAKVEWRVDDAPVETQMWVAAPEVVFTLGDQAAKVLDAIKSGSTLVLRVHGGGAVQDVVFALGDAAPPVADVEASCPH